MRIYIDIVLFPLKEVFQKTKTLRGLTAEDSEDILACGETLLRQRDPLPNRAKFFEYV